MIAFLGKGIAALLPRIYDYGMVYLSVPVRMARWTWAKDAAAIAWVSK